VWRVFRERTAPAIVSLMGAMQSRGGAARRAKGLKRRAADRAKTGADPKRNAVISNLDSGVKRSPAIALPKSIGRPPKPGELNRQQENALKLDGAFSEALRFFPKEREEERRQVQNLFSFCVRVGTGGTQPEDWERLRRAHAAIETGSQTIRVRMLDYVERALDSYRLAASEEIRDIAARNLHASLSYWIDPIFLSIGPEKIRQLFEQSRKQALRLTAELSGLVGAFGDPTVRNLNAKKREEALSLIQDRFKSAQKALVRGGLSKSPPRPSR
jgi:hypothetical protein